MSGSRPAPKKRAARKKAAGRKCEPGCECGRHRSKAKREPITVLAAVERDLRALGDDALAESGLAAAALELAKQLDGDHSLTSKSMASGRLQELMRELRELAPAKPQEDAIDDIAAQRARRRSA